MSARPTRRLLSALPVALALLGLGTATAPLADQAPAAESDLAADLDRILADPRLDGAQAGLEVRDAKTGDVLYAHDAGDRLLPASNTKLLTSAAALQVLGPEHRFTTSVLTTGRRAGSTLRGDLHLKGTGDPTTLASDYDALAKRVADAGISRVKGRLVADDTTFDDTRLGPFWSWDDEPYYYSAQVSALSVAPDTDYDAGSVIVRIAPGARAGAPAKVTVDPPNGYVRVVNRATTGVAGSDDTADAVRRHGNNVIDVTGAIPAGAEPDDVWATVWEPTGLVASLFTDALERHGVTVTEPARRGGTPPGAKRVATHRSMPLSELLVPFMKLSNNLHAEHLVKAMGRETSGEGSWSAGTSALLDAVAKLGVDADDVQLVDGSGLARADLVSPAQLNRLLLDAQDESWFDAWYESLPVAGNPDRLVGGTLRSRMAGTAAADNLHGKTGSLTGVSALSGYVTDASGDLLVFSLVSNAFVGSSSGVKAIEDAVGVTLAGHGGGSSTRVAPRTGGDDPPRNPMQRRNPDVECAWTKSC